VGFSDGVTSNQRDALSGIFEEINNKCKYSFLNIHAAGKLQLFLNMHAAGKLQFFRKVRFFSQHSYFNHAVDF